MTRRKWLEKWCADAERLGVDKRRANRRIIAELRALWAIVDADTPGHSFRDYDAIGAELDAYHAQQEEG